MTFAREFILVKTSDTCFERRDSANLYIQSKCSPDYADYDSVGVQCKILTIFVMCDIL